MLKPEQIPIEVRAVLQKACDSGEPWNIVDTLAAAINAWPGIKEEHRPNITFDGKPITVGYIILPLPKEPEHD